MKSHSDLMGVLECHCVRTDFLLTVERSVPEPEDLCWELDTDFSTFFDLSCNDSDCDFVLDCSVTLQRLGNYLEWNCHLSSQISGVKVSPVL